MLGFFKKPRSAGPAEGAFIRNTDADWERIGSSEPYFGVLTDPKFLRANIDDAVKVEFFRSGADEVAHHLLILRERCGPFEPRSALDFGCGVGRLTRALADTAGDAVGIDISDGMLREARAAQRTGLAFQKELPDRLFDWLISMIVFQHIQPDRGYQLLREIVRRLAPGGCVTLHFGFYREPRHYAVAGGRVGVGDEITNISGDAALRALAVGEMVMFDYDLSIIAALLFNAGVTELHLLHTNHGGFHGAVVYGRKPA